MKHLIAAILPLTITSVLADDGYGPSGIHHHPSAYKVPPGMVLGGAFVDRIQPMPVEQGLSANAWGGANVLPRNVENGLEDSTWSYWCMDVTHGADGKEHMFACRCPKLMATAGSNHSSKIIALPLTVQRRLAILNSQPITASTPDIQVVIKAEEGFDPATEVDEKSLTFGAPTEVDFGRGCKPLKSSPSGKDLIVTFSGEGNGFKPADYAGKLLGRNKRGELIFGYVRLPGQSFINPILSARSPEIAKPGIMTVKVENFGQVESKPAEMKWTITSAAGVVANISAKVPPILPYGSIVIAVPLDTNALKSDKPCNVETRIEAYGGSKPLVLQSTVRVSTF